MRIIVFEDEFFADLLPLTYWRATFELRCGTGTLLDHIRSAFGGQDVHLWVRDELADVVGERTGLPVNTPLPDGPCLLLNGRTLLREPLPDDRIGVVCQKGEAVVYARWEPGPRAAPIGPAAMRDAAMRHTVFRGLPAVRPDTESTALIRYPWDLLKHNVAMILQAWTRLGATGIEGHVYPGAHLLDERNIAIGRGSRIKPGATLDAERGPILIGEGVTVQPNAVIQGPCYLGDGTLVQIGAAIGDSSVGPVCKVGGEIESTILQGYSNKQHDGFLGHAYIGEFCNLAADTVNSDLKNTYSSVRVPINGVCVDSGEMFVGLTMGDHAKSGIGQLFTTGAVVGFGSSVATSRLAPKFVPSFRWLTDHDDQPYEVERCLRVAKKAMARRNRTLTEAEERLFRSLPEIARKHEHAGTVALS